MFACIYATTLNHIRKNQYALLFCQNNLILKVLFSCATDEKNQKLLDKPQLLTFKLKICNFSKIKLSKISHCLIRANYRCDQNLVQGTIQAIMHTELHRKKNKFLEQYPCKRKRILCRIAFYFKLDAFIEPSSDELV